MWFAIARRPYDGIGHGGLARLKPYGSRAGRRLFGDGSMPTENLYARSSQFAVVILSSLLVIPRKREIR